VLSAQRISAKGSGGVVGREQHFLSPEAAECPMTDHTATTSRATEPTAGFPNSGLATAIPNQFFSRVLPQIEAPEELVVSTYFFFAQQLPEGPSGKRRSPRYLTKRELAADATLAQALENLAGRADTPDPSASNSQLTTRNSQLEHGLDLSVWRGTLLRAHIGAGGREEELYVVNNPQNRKALEDLVATDLRLDDSLPPAAKTNGSSIFALYEQNIRPITPLIADELKEAEERYPEDWIRDAFREAVSLNKANWRYIESILRRWEAEGKQHEKSERDPQVEWLERRYREGKRRLNSQRHH
jgi:DnaD/phage-associated family protein